MEVDNYCDGALVGSKIQFHVASRIEADGDRARYTAVMARDGAWRCFDFNSETHVLNHGAFSSAEIKRHIMDGHWVVEGSEKPVLAYKMSHTAQRLKALAKLGVTTTFRPDGWVIFSSDWCRLEVSPESEFPEGLKKAEAVFGKD